MTLILCKYHVTSYTRILKIVKLKLYGSLENDTPALFLVFFFLSILTAIFKNAFCFGKKKSKQVGLEQSSNVLIACLKC